MLDPIKLREVVRVPTALYKENNPIHENPIIQKMIELRKSFSYNSDVLKLHDTLMETVFGADFKAPEIMRVPVPIFVRITKNERDHNYEIGSPCLLIHRDTDNTFKGLQKGIIGNWLRDFEFSVIPEEEITDKFLNSFCKFPVDFRDLDSSFRMLFRTLLTEEALKKVLKEER